MSSRGAGWIDATAFLLAALILAWQLFTSPVAGLANNGDFGKILGLFGLGAPAEDEYKFAPTRYSFDPHYRFRSGFYSSETLLVAAAIGLNALCSRPGSFDLRCVGAIHAALFLTALYLLLPTLRTLAPGRQALVLLVTVFIFCDAMYATSFNSFYMDTAALLFLLLAIALFLRTIERRRAISRWALVICCALLVTSKTQHFLLGLPIAVLLFWSGPLLSPHGGQWFGRLAAGVVLAATAFSATAAPAEYGHLGIYSAIFTRILPNSRDVARDLRELGLDESHRRYIGTHTFSAEAPMNDPAFVQDFHRRTSYGRLAWFYVKHAGRACEAVRFSLDGAGRQRPAMGNFDRSLGLPPFAESRRFAWWSSLKQSIFCERGALYLAYFVCLATLVCGFVMARRLSLPKGLPEAAGALAVMALLEMLVASLGDAVESTRHFFLFNALLDVLAGAAVVVLTGWRRSPRPRLTVTFRPSHRLL